MSGEIGVGVLGQGFMGRTHIRALQAAREAGLPCRLVAVHDRNPARRGGRSPGRGNLEVEKEQAGLLFDPTQVKEHDRADGLLADPGVHLVCICTHTDSHVELATAALEAGKHVLVEKPLALTSEEAEKVVAAARAASTVCMPAMCMRFWPGWTWLHDRIADGSLGAVRSAVFRRLGTRPGWAPAFYGDPARCGGALFDLHVHDADLVRWCFGAPEAVTCTGTVDHLTALYHFPSGPSHVVAEGGWDHAAGWPFTMRFTVVFEQATADFELGRSPPLLLHREGRAEPVPLPSTTGYDGQIRHLLEVISGSAGSLGATCGEAAAVVALLEAEARSLAGEGTVRVASS